MTDLPSRFFIELTQPEIAGGGAALVSTSFLRFFEEFSYASIGIGCTLDRDVCHMSGVEPI